MRQKGGPISSRCYLLLGGMISLIFLAGCVFGGGDSDPTPRPTTTDGADATATPEPSPSPEATEPPPTATPTPIISGTVAETLVFSHISVCADQLVGLTEGEIEPDFSTAYNPDEGSWIVDAYNRDPALTFGIWIVTDDSGDIKPEDNVATEIDTAESVCVPPIATRAKGRTPPRFAEPTPTPAPTSTPLPTVVPSPPLKVASISEAATSVWISVYNCFGNFPQIESFTATEDGPTRWVVEGRSEATVYGLWLVDAVTGEIIPADEVARKAESECLTTPEVPVSLTAEQASLRAWMAAYQCFNPPPELSSFNALPLTPQRWVVEGRKVAVEIESEGGPAQQTEEVFYGFWQVDTDTGEIQPWDNLAESLTKVSCFKQP